MNTETKDEVVYLYLDDIIPNRFQPREVFDERALKELALSIKEHGVIQPIIVRRVNGKYEIIAGERRYKASALAGMTKIPAIIRDLDDKESSKVALLENLQRKNLNPIEEARTYQKILELDQMTQDELAKTMGKSQSAVANKLRLLALPDEVQDSLLKEQISERHARALLNLPDAKQQKELLKKIITNKMTVRAVEEEIAKISPKRESQGSQMPQASETIPSVASNATIGTSTTPSAMASNPMNYGQVTISPPTENNNQTVQKFINYGEIDKEAVEEPKDSYYNEVEVQPVDVSTIKENAMDIKPIQNEPIADLDSLLNITPVVSQNNEQKSQEPSEQKYLTPAEAIVKGDATAEEESIKDYFNMPNIKATDLPQNISSTQQPAATQQSSILNIPNPQVEAPTGNYDLPQIINKIREVVKDIENHGGKVTFDEMDFATAYQVIIKIDK